MKNKRSIWHTKYFILLLASLVITYLTFCLCVEWILPTDLSKTDLMAKLELPTFLDPESPYILGTDQLGRDVFRRLLYATKTTIEISLTGMLGASIIGILIGTISGYLGGWVDNVIQFVTETFLSVPTTFVGIVIATILGATPTTIIIAMISTGWASFCRIFRGQVLQIKQGKFIETSRVLGASHLRIIFEHVLPNAASIIIVHCTAAFSGFILSESSLSFLGIGIQPPKTSLGIMIADGRDYLMTHWWLAIAPSVIMIFLILSMSLIGDWLRDYLDPKLRASMRK